MTKVKVSEVLVSTWLGPKNIVRDVITCAQEKATSFATYHISAKCVTSERKHIAN